MRQRMDGDKAEDVVIRAEMALGRKLFRNYSGPPLRNVRDFAEAICQELKLAEGGPCPCIAEYRKVCEVVAEFSPEAEVSPRSELGQLIGKRRERGWRELCRRLGMKPPEMVIGTGLGISFVFLLAAQCVLLFLAFNVVAWNVPLSIALSVAEVTVAESLMRRWWPRRRPWHLCTVADLVCYSVLYPLLREEGPAREWTRGDVRLLARYLVAEATGTPVHELKARTLILE